MADEENQQSPWTRPGFITAAIVVGVIVIAGIVVSILALNQSAAAPPQPTSTSSAAPAPSPTAAAGGSSVCGLKGVELTGTVTQAPPTTWKYQDVYAYPTSPTAGPGATAPSGYRYCFQHTPQGALFMAANALVQGSSAGAARDAWSQYVYADGPYRATLLEKSAASAGNTGVRSTIKGFRVLNYNGATATVDLAVTVSGTSGTTTVSGVYALVWADGDWKVSTDIASPLNVAPIPDVAGYTLWGANDG